MRVRLTRLAGFAAVLVVVVGCGSSEEATPISTSTVEGVVSSTATSTSTVGDVTSTTGDVEIPTTTLPVTTTTPPTTIDPNLFALEVKDGEVIGGIPRFKIDVGATATVVVTADVNDHVHLHGYDILTDVTPGEPVTISWEADIPGIFEAELEDGGQEIFEVEVS